ncbi:MAG: hypothetical protein QNJ37_12020 [Crocosphaera sp.]|nr:hypothetical protein [Crocosphaera sp.]
MIDNKYTNLITKAKDFFDDYYIVGQGHIVYTEDNQENIRFEYEQAVEREDYDSQDKEYLLDYTIYSTEVLIVEKTEDREDWINIFEKIDNDNIIITFTVEYKWGSWNPDKNKLDVQEMELEYYFLFDKDGKLIDHYQDN